MWLSTLLRAKPQALPHTLRLRDSRIGEHWDSLHCHHASIDSYESNPASKLLVHILAAVAQFERELIHEQVSAGIRAAEAHGTKTANAIGRPCRIFSRDEVVRLRETGLSIQNIAGQIRIGVGTVVRVLQTAGNVQTA